MQFIFFQSKLNVGIKMIKCSLGLLKIYLKQLFPFGLVRSYKPGVKVTWFVTSGLVVKVLSLV